MDAAEAREISEDCFAGDLGVLGDRTLPELVPAEEAGQAFDSHQRGVTSPACNSVLWQWNERFDEARELCSFEL